MRVQPYESYADFYDRIGQRFFGEAIARETLRWLADELAPGAPVLDLACGTGAATFVFAGAGFQTTGVDRSREMLAQAEKIATERALNVALLCQDIRELTVSRRVSLATCFYDSINYLADTVELQAVFDRVFECLLPGGHFIFDVNTRRRLAEGWDNGCVVAADSDDLFVTYRSWFDIQSSTSPLIMTAFVRADDGRWDRFEEEHVERAFEIEEISEALLVSGFSICDSREYHDRPGRVAGPVTDSTERVIIWATRPATAEPA
jgi:SAM-dependent methyltransferase